MTALATDSGRRAPARLAGSAVLACQSDDRLVRLVREGHERAFEAIVDRYRKQLLRFSSRILPESRSEDAVQQAFLNAHTGLLMSDEPVQLKPWLFAITRNAALNMLRQNGWNYDQIPLDFDGVPRPDQIFEQRIELQQTVAAMNELPDRQRNALVMRELEGRSYDEIARALGTGDGAVRQLLNRARGSLRAALSALIPPPLVARAAASLPQSDGRRIAEVMSGFGAAGVAKVGATALVAGSLVVGAVNAPIPIVSSGKATREKATMATPAAKQSPAAKSSAVPSAPAGATFRPAVQKSSRGSGKSGTSHSRHGSSQLLSPGHRGGEGPSGSGSGSGDNRSGSSGDTRSRTEDRSGSTSGGSTSGSSGSDSKDTSSGSADPSGTSGSSDTSGSSGTSGSGSTTSGLDSGSSTTSSTSGSSGSGSSTSGSSDGTTTTTTSASPLDN